MGKILFVCSGNTCRSPMAEGIFNKRAEEMNIKARALSAGAAALAGVPASANAVAAAAEKGADISKHLSQPVTERLLEECTAVLCMTAGQARSLKAAFPAYKDEIRLLSRNDISDPFGGELADYRRAADEIERAVDRLCEALSE